MRSSSNRNMRLFLAGAFGVLLLLACSLPLNAANLTSNAPTQPLDLSEQPLETPPPTPHEEVPAPLDPLVILDTYPSLADVRNRLIAIVATQISTGSQLTGRQLLEWVLVDQGYSPQDDIASNQQLLAALNDYDLELSGNRIFLINVATGLYAEAHHLVPWSLNDYDSRLINNLFILDSTVKSAHPPNQRGDLPANMPNLEYHYYPVDNQMIEDAHYKQFNLARSLTQGAATQEEAISMIVVWMQQNFFHAIEGYGWEVYLDGRTPYSSGPAAFPLSIERIYEERVIGCHEPTILLEGMLHSLNIPALRLLVHGHGVLYLPSLDRYIHGDHIANYTDASLGVLLLTPDEFRPFAEDKIYIYQIFFDKYQSPLLSVPLVRAGGDLHILSQGLYNRPELTCIQVSEADWARVSDQLSAYNIRYDNNECTLSSDSVAIKTLDQLNQSTP